MCLSNLISLFRSNKESVLIQAESMSKNPWILQGCFTYNCCHHEFPSDRMAFIEAHKEPWHSYDIAHIQCKRIPLGGVCGFMLDVITVDLRGVPRCLPPLRPKMFSISCSFGVNFTKSYVGAPSWRMAPLLRGILDPPLVCVYVWNKRYDCEWHMNIWLRYD